MRFEAFSEKKLQNRFGTAFYQSLVGGSYPVPVVPKLTSFPGE